MYAGMNCLVSVQIVSIRGGVGAYVSGNNEGEIQAKQQSGRGGYRLITKSERTA